MQLMDMINVLKNSFEIFKIYHRETERGMKNPKIL